MRLLVLLTPLALLDGRLRETERVLGIGKLLFALIRDLLGTARLSLRASDQRILYAPFESTFDQEAGQKLPELLVPPVPIMRDVKAPVLERRRNVPLGHGSVELSLGVRASLAAMLATDEGKLTLAQERGLRLARREVSEQVKG